MQPPDLSRLHALRMDNDQAGYDMDEMRPRFDRLANRHNNGAAPRAVSAFNLFQTPPELAAELVRIAEIEPGARVLEPSAGLGRLLVEILKRQPGETVAVEESNDCARELFNGFPTVRLLERDFLTLSPDETGTFDRVCMNPPFKMRRDLKHIRHALTFLRPGGVLSGLCLAGPIREKELRSMASVWRPIPARAFRAEGTDVETILFTIRA